MAPPSMIAVVGIGCRFAGDIDHPSKLWDLISEGQRAWSPVPSERWNDGAFRHPYSDMPGMMNHHGGHFIKRDMSAFDAGFFEIGAQESQAMDPQQRLLLETSYEALENAGLPLEKVKGSNTGVYVAAFAHDYEHMTHKDDLNFAKYYANGLGSTFFSNRLSFFYDFHGPSISVETACSGSLVALHLAAESLRSGESDMAMVAGSNLMLEPDMMEGMSLLHLTNPDGRSYSFDSRGAGYGRGEGVATIVIKRLEDAVAAGDPIHAVIRGTGINSDGYTRAGISVPSGSAQEALIRSVYQKAELDPQDTIYFEAHGTGTAVGDVVEVNAIARALRPRSKPDQEEVKAASHPLYLGSVKANIGHAEACAGLAGLIKAILVLQNEVIPPVADLRSLKNGLLPSGCDIVIPTECVKWPPETIRRASVNSFGYGGTNSMCILEIIPKDRMLRELVSAGKVENDTGDDRLQSHIVIPFTANSKVSLQHMIKRLSDWLETRVRTARHMADSHFITNLAYTLSERRTMMPWRFAVAASANSPDMLRSSLEAALSSLSSSFLTRTVTQRPPMTYLFTGQGAQWFAMGRELLHASATFKESVAKSAKFLSIFGTAWSLFEELERSSITTRLNNSEIGQPCSTAIQIALVDLLASFGVKPSNVVGHSSGEIAAAYACQAISHEDAMKISYARGFLSKRAKDANSVPGSMLAVRCGEKSADDYIRQIKSGRLVVACLNSQSSVTISGDAPAIDELERILPQGLSPTRLAVDTAYHSHHMEAVAQSYLNDLVRLGGIKVQPSLATSDVRFISTVTGEAKYDGFDEAYWVENLVSPVRFYQALEKCGQLRSEGKGATRLPRHIFLEVGPHHGLKGPTKATVATSMPEIESFCLPTLVRDRNAVETLLQSAAILFQTGTPLFLNRINCLGGQQVSRKSEVLRDLPPYPWDLSHVYWHESHVSKSHRSRAHPYHELLGVRNFSVPLDEPYWRYIVSLESIPWLRDHQVDGSIVFPATGYMCMAIEAKKQITADRKSPGALYEASSYVLKDLNFVKSLVVPESPATVEIRLSLRPAYPKGVSREKSLGYWEEFTVHSIDENGRWRTHCSGKVSIEFAPGKQGPDASHDDEDRKESIAAEKLQLQRLKEVLETADPSLDYRDMYQDLTDKGNYYGESFALVRRYQMNERTQSCTGDVVIPDVTKLMPHPFMQPFTIHPTTLDALTHTSLPLFRLISNATSCMTVGAGEVRISAEISNTPGELFEFVNGVRLTSRTSAETQLSVFQRHPKTGERVLVIETSRSQLQAISSTETDLRGVSEHVARGKTVHSHEWLLDVDLTLPKRGFQFQDLGPSEAELLPAEQDYLLNQATALYVSNVLAGLSPVDVHPGQKQYFDTLSRFRESQQASELLNGLREDDGRIPALDAVAARVILHAAENMGVEGQAVTRVGTHLHGILTGQVDTHNILFSDDLMAKVYAVESYQRCYQHMAHFIRALSRKNPDLRAMELGAGTGGATLALFSELSKDNLSETGGGSQNLPFESYDFTDVSRSFSQNVHEGPLAQWSKGTSNGTDIINFKVFDLNKTLEEQTDEFQLGSYDIILASNALHVSKKLGDALATVKSLLKPGGWLLLVETTYTNPYVNLLFGVFSGWHDGIEDGRLGCPTLSTVTWNDRLIQSGFNGTAYVAHDYEGVGQKSSFIASQSEVSSLSALPQVVIVLPRPAPGFYCSSEHLEFAKALRIRLEQRPLVDISIETRQIHEIEYLASGEKMYIVLEDMAQPLLGRPINPAAFTQIRTLVTAASKVLWASIAHNATAVENPETALIAGVLRSAREEHNEKELVIFTMQTPPFQNDVNDVVERLEDVFHAAFLSDPGFRSGQIDNEWAYSHGRLLVPRLLVNKTVDDVLRSIVVEPPVEPGNFHQPDRPLKLEIVSPGVLETIRFVDDDSIDPLEIESDMIEIKTAAFGLNPKDMIILMGQNRRAGLSYTGECAGIVTAVGTKWKATLKAGDRVCAWAASNPFPSRVRVSGHHVWRIPDHMSLEEASTIPVAWGTAWRALIGIAKMRPGQSLLIHAAAGAVGQAVIEVARNVLGVTEIYATCSSAKRDFLVEKLGIPESRIFNSRSASFKRAILRVTGGRGVDVVVNSLKGDLLRESLDCVAQLGTFIEIGKDDILSKALVTLEPLDRGITISAFDLTDLAMLRPQETHDMIQDVLNYFGGPERSSMVSHIKPLSKFDLSQLDEALRVMRTGHHTGKLVITASENTQVSQIPRGIPVPKLDGSGVHLIPGGAGGIGRVIGRWMLERGAKRVALLSRRDANAETKAELERESQEFSAEIQVVRCDVSVEADVAALAEMYHQQGIPVRGIVHSAATLHDTELADMSVDEFEGAVKPKVDGTRFVLKYFDTPDLDYILLLSSAAGILGPRGASNYAAANAYMDMLSYTYHPKHAHLLVLNLGPVKEAGIVARNRRLYDVFMKQGFVEVTNKEIRRLLDYSCGPAAQRDQCHQIITSLSRDAFEACNPVALNRPLLRLLPSAKLRDVSTTEEQGKRADTQLSIREILSSAEHPDQALEKIIPVMVAKVADLTGVDAASLEEDHPLESIGMDSLTVIDLKNWISRQFGVSMQPNEIMESLGVSILANTLVNKSPFLRLVAPLARLGFEDEAPLSSETARRIVSSGRDDSDKNEVQSQTSSLGDSGIEVHTPSPPKSGHGPILNQMLDEFLLAATCVSQSKEELAETKRRVKAVKEAAARGQFSPLDALEQQAHALEANGSNWITHFSLGLPFLETRSPLVPSQNVFAVHPIRDGVAPTAIERATTLALAACRCLENILQDGNDANAQYGGLAVPRLFNSVRLPRSTIDKVVKYHIKKFFIVFYHGHAFKVTISVNVSWTKLNAMLHDIAHLGNTLGDPGYSVAALTTAARPVWADLHDRLGKIDEINVVYLDTIEKAAFILCIDTEDISLPMSPHEMSKKIFLGDGRNRWQDKGLQLVACSNGLSGHIIEHSLGDDRSSEPLAKLMGQGIFEEEEVLIFESREQKRLIYDEEKPSLIEVRLDSVAIEEARRAIDDLSQRTKACVVEVRTLPARQGDNRKWTVDLVQLVLHLASLRFFGSHFSSVESIQGFHRGTHARAVLADTTLPEVWAFCDSISSSQQVTTEVSSKLLSDALGALKNRRADKLAIGISWNWYLPALHRAFAAAGGHGPDVVSGSTGSNELESLLDDPVYRRCLVPRLWANKFPTSAIASGNWIEAKGTVRTRYDFGNDGSVKFHMFANDSDVDAFWLEIEKAAKDIERF